MKKNQLLELRNYLTSKVGMKENSQATKNISLDDKVDEFINWYADNIVEGTYSNTNEYCTPREMRNFIEKMAVWYELRYPDYEINRLMPGSGQEQNSISKVMFNDNPYINSLLDCDADTRELDWDEFYNTKVFIQSLPWNEKKLFSRPEYQDVVCWNRDLARSPHLHLTRNGFVKKAEFMEYITFDIDIYNEELVGKNIKEIVKMLKERHIKFPENNEFEKAIKDYDNWIYQKDEMLNCVMYRIIERGGNMTGCRRAFLFAKEFGRNIDIPMMYAVDRAVSDCKLRSFINEYIKAGGSKDLVCYIGYGSRKSKYEKLPTITIQELIMTQNNAVPRFYTPEEDELHKRLVNALVSNINQDELSKEQEKLKKEEVEQLRLQKKLEKSRQVKSS